MLLTDTDRNEVKMFLKTSTKTKSYLTLAITQKIQNIAVV